MSSDGTETHDVRLENITSLRSEAVQEDGFTPCNAKEKDVSTIVLKLYVVGSETTDGGIFEKMRSACDEVCLNGYTLELVNVLTSPHVAEEAGVFVTPTLVREIPPSPESRVIGDFSDPFLVLEKINLGVLGVGCE